MGAEGEKKWRLVWKYRLVLISFVIVAQNLDIFKNRGYVLIFLS